MLIVGEGIANKVTFTREKRVGKTEEKNSKQ